MPKKLTTEEWVRKAKDKFGDQVDYSKVVYVNANTKVTIVCPIHGDVQVIPGHYTRNDNACPCCGRTGRKTTANFINECLYKFPDKNYDYSKVDYVDANTLVTITCPVHGDFKVKPYSFIQGHHCPYCGVEERNRKNSSTLEEFVTKAKKVHGDKYNYSKAEYKNNRTKICIICSEHGEFHQTPDSHLSGCGCPECSRAKAATYNMESFLRNARKVHKDKYDYSKVAFNRATDKVTIICPEHGEFEQTVHSHLAGCGCSKCATRLRAEECRFTKEQFVKNAEYLHGSLYDYSEVDYVNNYTPVTIICRQHGRFKQLPSNHMKGAGCPLCTKASKGEKLVAEILRKRCIEFVPQYSVSSKVNPSGFLLVDFYLPKYNTFIEFNGQQHYVPIIVMGGQIRFEQQQARDEELRQYCKDNNIKLIEIRYDEDVWEVLTRELPDNQTTNEECK